MGQAVEVTCPTCKKIFVVNPHMLGSQMDFHCPYCNLYFPEKDSPKFASRSFGLPLRNHGRVVVF